MKHAIVLLGLFLISTTSWSCESGRKSECKKVLALLSLRVDAMQTAFGDMSIAMPTDLDVRFVSSRDPDYRWVRGSIYYDADRQTLLLPRAIARAKTPAPLRHAAYYWPFYLNAELRKAFPVVEHIDNAIWSTFLLGAARMSGQSWPHSNCHAADINKRLPCRMLLAAAARLVKTQTEPFYNENRLDRIWPDDIASFEHKNYRADDSAYADVVRLGGFPLLRPLVAEFGLPRVLAYIAQNPLVVEDNSLRTSALRYQDRARSALSADRSPQAVAQLSTSSRITVRSDEAIERE